MPSKRTLLTVEDHETSWALRRLIKVELAKRDWSMAWLTDALRLKHKGHNYKDRSLQQKIAKGTYPAVFLAHIADAMDCELAFVPKKPKD